MYLVNLVINRVRTLFQRQISRTFPGIFKDLDWFFKGSKSHINPYTPKISMLILLTAFHTLLIFFVELKRFPELSRTSGLFLGLSCPGKCQNKIPGLSRFSRTRTNPASISTDWQSLDAKFRSEKGQTRNHSTTNNFLSSNAIVWTTQISHAEGLEITATPEFRVLFDWWLYGMMQ